MRTQTGIAKYTLMVGCEPSWYLSGLPIYTAAKIPSINCMNTEQDFKSSWEFGLEAGAQGDSAAFISYMCSQPAVKTVVDMVIDLPSEHNVFDTAVKAPLQACGKKAIGIYVPTTVADLTPYVAKAAQAKPQFVTANFSATEVPQVYAGLEQDGIPASHIVANGIDFTHAILAKAPQMKGGIVLEEFNPWTLTK